MNINHILTEIDINDIDVKSQLEHQIQIQERKGSGWVLDEINSMRIRFYKIFELNSSSFVKIPLRSNPMLKIENNDKYWFLWSTLASCVFVKPIILTEFQLKNNILMN